MLWHEAQLIKKTCRPVVTACASLRDAGFGHALKPIIAMIIER
jgi:hypothetical protein